MDAEPTIIINGKQLTTAQAMTLRVANSNFASDLRTEGLGDDEMSRAIAADYLARTAEIEALMLSHISNARTA